MTMVIDKLVAIVTDEPMVVLLNNLGGATDLEMAVLANELLDSKFRAS
jgi:dihydroxyacetone kinase